ncbi:MAG TPA: hypothetical protein DEA96_04195 [Leptospiraceae bacterium]|nr:hypothetical protein [Spirochaetaceae bacterium]HBS04143.1 hypothetical protein [Leptospiraceae bacterium]
MEVKNARAPADHPDTAPGWKDSDTDLQSVEVEKLANYDSEGKYANSTVWVRSNLHLWQLGEITSRYSGGNYYSVTYRKKTLKLDQPLEGSLKKVFGPRVSHKEKPDYRLEVDISNVRMSAPGVHNKLVLINTLSLVTLTLVPGFTEKDRMNIQVRLRNSNGATICQRNLGIESYYSFSLWYLFVPWMQDTSPFFRGDRDREPYYTEDEMGNIVAYMIETCPALE